MSTKKTVSNSDLRNFFGEADVNGDGQLSLPELTELATKLGMGISDTEMKRLFILMDEDGSGEIDCEEFIIFYRTESGRSATLMKNVVDKMVTEAKSTTKNAVGIALEDVDEKAFVDEAKAASVNDEVLHEVSLAYTTVQMTPSIQKCKILHCTRLYNRILFKQDAIDEAVNALCRSLYDSDAMLVNMGYTYKQYFQDSMLAVVMTTHRWAHDAKDATVTKCHRIRKGIILLACNKIFLDNVRRLKRVRRERGLSKQKLNYRAADFKADGIARQSSLEINELSLVDHGSNNPDDDDLSDYGSDTESDITDIDIGSMMKTTEFKNVMQGSRQSCVVM
jgi:EF-hand domain pair